MPGTKKKVHNKKKKKKVSFNIHTSEIKAIMIKKNNKITFGKTIWFVYAQQSGLSMDFGIFLDAVQFLLLMFFVTVNHVKNPGLPLISLAVGITTTFESARVDHLNIDSLALVGAGISGRWVHHLSNIAPIHCLSTSEQVPAHLETAHLKGVVYPV